MAGMNRIQRFFITQFLVMGVVTAMVLTPISGVAGQSMKPMSNLSFRLQAMYDSTVSPSVDTLYPQDQTLFGMDGGGLMTRDDGRILVYMRVSDLSENTLSVLKAKGAVVTHVSQKFNTVTAFIFIRDLQTLASLTEVRNIREVLTPLAHAITTEGDVQLRADKAREAYKVDGTGIMVGVLSDSYGAVLYPTSADDDILSGDLPGPGNPFHRTVPVKIIEDAVSGVSDEGRAMMQIVHDIAPGAALAFATAWGGLYSFADNILKLRKAGCSIVVDDISYFVEPMFQDGPVSNAIREITEDGALYFTSAGNSNSVDGNGHNVASYEAANYRPGAGYSLFSSGVPADNWPDFHQFDPAGGIPYQEFVLSSQGGFICIMQWAEPWYDVKTDLDLLVTDSAGNILTASLDTNTGPGGTQVPFEAVSYQNTSGGTQTVRLTVVRYSGIGMPRVKYVFIRSGGIQSSLVNATSNVYDSFGPSILGHSGAKEAVSVAAVPFDDSTTPEYFTSLGGFTVYFEPVSGTSPALPLTTPEVREKPDIAATDGGVTTFFGQQDGAVYRFYGTSAAAPHAAGVAALISQKYREVHGVLPDQATVEIAMEKSASAIENGGPEASGAGLLNAMAAVPASVYGTAIPTLSVWGIMVLGILLALAGILHLKKAGVRSSLSMKENRR